MKFYKLVFISILCLLLWNTNAQKAYQTWQQNPSIAQAQVAYSFLDLEDNSIVAEYQQNKLLNPASTLKLLTSFIFLEKVGRDHQFETQISYNGTIEKDGTLQGDLIIFGKGDPSFASARYGEQNSMDAILDQAVLAIRKAGITCVDGDIITDASYFGSDCTPHTWQYNDLGNYYASGVWSTNINENAYKLSLKRSTSIKGSTGISTIVPPVPGLYFSNELELGDANSGDQAYIFCAPYQQQAFVRGSIPIGRGDFSIRGSIPNAPMFLAQIIQTKLASIGIQSQKADVRFEKGKQGKTIWNHRGIKANRQVRSAIHKSINLYCESFLKHLGKGDREKAVKVIEDYLIKHDCLINADAIQISDGSGLSQRNFITTNTMVKFIAHINDALGSKEMQYFLARNGYDGTLKNAFTSKSLKGKIYGKSGSMGGVRAYAGILETKSGKQLAFSIIVNNYTVSSRKITQQIEALLELTVQS